MNVELIEKAREQFKSPLGRDVDVLYVTSDGNISLSSEKAQGLAALLPDKEVVPVYRDGHLRTWGKGRIRLENMIFATDVVKQYRAEKRGKVSYDTYTNLAAYHKTQPVDKSIFDFIQSKVYSSRKPVMAGQPDHIFTWRWGIVQAVFLRRYESGQIFQYMDQLILTCPTNIELMSGSYYDIFGAFLGKKPE